MPKLAIIVAGGRDYSLTEDDKLFLSSLNPSLIIQGGASGADRGAKLWAMENGIEEREFKASWKLYGPAAGVFRNRFMAKYLNELDGYKIKCVVLFPGGKGTANMKMQAVRLGLDTVEVSGDNFKGKIPLGANDA